MVSLRHSRFHEVSMLCFYDKKGLTIGSTRVLANMKKMDINNTIYQLGWSQVILLTVTVFSN
jgi:hypothetical protein